ncbi:hypothetical protein [Celeribacter marinus]|uniref:hypothetical protein n=1 Tax=Celeribacter marinus TaxID=1397108 RepID=UPI003174D0D7
MKTFLAKLRKAALIFGAVVVSMLVLLILAGEFSYRSLETPEVRAERAEQEKLADAKANLERRLIEQVVLAIKGSLRNPDSLSIRLVTVLPDGEICINYGAQNGFGGVNVEQVAFADGEFVDFGKTCTGKSGRDLTDYFRYY